MELKVIKAVWGMDDADLPGCLERIAVAGAGGRFTLPMNTVLRHITCTG